MAKTRTPLSHRLGLCARSLVFCVGFVDHSYLVVSFSWSLYCRSFFNLWLSGVVLLDLQFSVQCLQIIVLLSLSFIHCIVVPSSIYDLVGFVFLDLQFSVQCFVDHWLSCCPFLLTIVLSFLLQSMAQRVRVARSLVFCVVFCRSLFVLSLSFAIVLSSLLQSMAQWGSCYSIFSFLCSVLQIIVCLVVPFSWPVYCRSLFNL